METPILLCGQGTDMYRPYFDYEPDDGLVSSLLEDPEKGPGRRSSAWRLGLEVYWCGEAVDRK